MKDQLIEKLRELISSEDIMSVRDNVRTLRSDWKAETVKERQLQQTAFKAEEHPEDEEFVFTPNEELETVYQELNDQYEQRIEEQGKILAAERQKNLEGKLAILKEFKTVVENEQDIPKAFSSHNDIKDRWNAIGDVPGDKHHELMDEWQKLNHEFYYNIDIYKSLQEHDLKINQKKKEELIEAVKSLESEQDLQKLNELTRKYQKEWMDIGPSPRETYKEQGDTFFGILREYHNKIQAYYDSLHAESEENLVKKKELVKKVENILSMEMTNVSTWQKWADEVKNLQEQWKEIGWTKKKENDDVWSEFRGLCDLFFTKRSAFFDVLQSGYKENKSKKEALIEKAKAQQNSEDWKGATDVLKRLQEEWKKVGAAGPRDEQKLWQQFRSVCDHFFNRKKENFASQVEEQQQNLLVKEEMLKELEAIEMTGNKSEDLTTLRAFSDRWFTAGFVPKKDMKPLMDRYNALLDVKYGKINANREEREMGEFRNRIANLKGGSDSDSKMRREKSFLRDKMDRLKKEIAQYENNMAIFTGKGAEALKKDIEKKIKAAEREVNDLMKKINMLDSSTNS